MNSFTSLFSCLYLPHNFLFQLDWLDHWSLPSVLKLFLLLLHLRTPSDNTGQCEQSGTDNVSQWSRKAGSHSGTAAEEPGETTASQTMRGKLWQCLASSEIWQLRGQMWEGGFFMGGCEQRWTRKDKRLAERRKERRWGRWGRWRDMWRKGTEEIKTEGSGRKKKGWPVVCGPVREQRRSWVL